jgi:hypothetical protein
VPEILIALLMVLLLLGTGLVATFVPWTWLLGAGVACAGLGLIFGIPASLEYHLRLARALRALGPLPRGWWLHPTPHHEKLAQEPLAHVMKAFWVGAAGFSLSLIGCLLVVASLFVG